VYLFGDQSSLVYKILFLVFTFLGSIITATNILDFSDLMILGMAFPNILGLFILSGLVRKDLTITSKACTSDKFAPFLKKIILCNF
jgi:AGCS family alanine or glycine:cation symporter